MSLPQLIPDAWSNADKYVVMLWTLRVIVAIPVIAVALYLIATRPWQKVGRR